MIEAIEKAKKEINSKLNLLNDPDFIFDEPTHVYRYKNVKFDSVTTYLKTFKTPFDKTYWSRKKANERGVDASVILKEWQNKGDVANDLGTKVHKFIEDFWSGLNPELPEVGTEYRARVDKFMNLYERKFHSLVPLKSELRVFSKKWRIAGTIDQPFLFWDSKRNRVLFILGDWKTNGEFKDDNHEKGRYKKLLRPFNTLYENHHNEYSIQISLYRLILQEELGIETESGFLCHIGPDDEPKIYPAKDLREPLRAYLDQNRCNNMDIFDLS